MNKFFSEISEFLGGTTAFLVSIPVVTVNSIGGIFDGKDLDEIKQDADKIVNDFVETGNKIGKQAAPLVEIAATTVLTAFISEEVKTHIHKKDNQQKA